MNTLQDTWGIFYRIPGEYFTGFLGNTLQDTRVILYRIPGEYFTGHLGNTLQDSRGILYRILGEYFRVYLVHMVPEYLHIGKSTQSTKRVLYCAVCSRVK